MNETVHLGKIGGIRIGANRSLLLTFWRPSARVWSTTWSAVSTNTSREKSARPRSDVLPF
jgi:hypothetical protein